MDHYIRLDPLRMMLAPRQVCMIFQTPAGYMLVTEEEQSPNQAGVEEKIAHWIIVLQVEPMACCRRCGSGLVKAACVS